ncbi:acyl-CoA N-acyltransferase [Ceratobasidium sp. AG-I]|nr:acyl-CoA N-acyltransferase [Ceratobasidium sp. AG-I]
MVVVNNFVPATKSPVTIPNPDEPYDLNFRYPVRELETDRLKLVPFVPSIYAQPLFEAIQLNPELLYYLPWHPFKTVHEFELHYERLIRSDPAWCVFAILDKSKLTDETDPSEGKQQTQSCLTSVSSDAPITVGHALAGTIGYLNAAPESASVEIGYAIVLPAYQRTFVSTHAIGLLLQYAFELPEDNSKDNDLGGGGGLGLRRVQWQANANNAASIRAAQRMGLKLEGIHRWQRTLDSGKQAGIKVREGDTLQRPGRHSAMLAMCWDDWQDGGREHVRKVMARRS